MKEIKEEIQKTSVYTYYEATDGTVFPNKEECEKYEKSALGVLSTKVSKLKVGDKYDAWDMMGGIDDHFVVAFKLNNKADADTLLQFLYLVNPWLLEEHRKERKKEIEETVNIAAQRKDVILFGINCDNEYYFINSRQNIIDNLNNLDKIK